MRSKLFFIASALVVAGGLYAGVMWFRPHTFHGTVIQSPDLAHDFTLNSANGRTVSLSDYRGKLVLLYFGYTFCPDVCPATLGNTAQALHRLGEAETRLQMHLTV